MRITLLLMILSIPPLIEVSSRSSGPADRNSPSTQAGEAQARTSSLWMVPVVEAILIAGFGLVCRERQRLDDSAESAPAREGRRPLRVAWDFLIH